MTNKELITLRNIKDKILHGTENTIDTGSFFGKHTGVPVTEDEEEILEIIARKASYETKIMINGNELTEKGRVNISLVSQGYKNDNYKCVAEIHGENSKDILLKIIDHLLRIGYRAKLSTIIGRL